MVQLYPPGAKRYDLFTWAKRCAVSIKVLQYAYALDTSFSPVYESIYNLWRYLEEALQHPFATPNLVDELRMRRISLCELLVDEASRIDDWLVSSITQQ